VIRLSVAATIISVMVMIITLAFASGFQKTVSQKIFSFWGHIRVQNYEAVRVSIAEETPIIKNDTVLNLGAVNPEIRKVQVFATKNAIIKSSESIEMVLLKGVDNHYDFSNLANFLVQGRWVRFDDSSYNKEIVLSEYTATQLGLKLNDQLLIFFIQPDGSSPRTRKLSICGIYKTGIEEYDKLIAIGDIRLIQRLNDWDQDQIGGYEIFLKDFNKMDEVSEDIAYRIPLGLRSNTIRQIYPSIFDWLSLQNYTIIIVLGIMIAIAILNLITCLLILVLERTRMVGVLKAIGAGNFTVQKVFLYQGAIITVTGIFFGNLFGLLICWLQQTFGLIKLPEEAYYISQAAVDVIWWHVVLIDLGTFLICFLVLLIPTLIVRKIQPVRVIQFR
jgi:lipoprotein-releasing system permease protein